MKTLPSDVLQQRTCWLFCTVIDNFGDIGVSRRLAQILQREAACRVYLWLDDEASLRRLCPDLPPLPCVYQGIEFRLWREGVSADIAGATEPDIVIETFGCHLPSEVLDTVRRCRPLWLNWEYLSAEDWAEAMHGKPSLQADGSGKYFWLMGFGEQSGGLLRERDYAERISGAVDFRRQLGLPERDRPSENRAPTEPHTGNTAETPVQEWLLFGYESPVWAQWLEMWRQHGRALRLLLAGGKIIDSLKEAGCIPETVLQNDGERWQSGCIELFRLPFTAQDDFDRLLAATDGLIVRGEDSFVRAQFSGKPFLWHIYPQDENAHLDKLAAFWQKTAACFPPELFAAHQALSDELNGGRVLMPSERLAAWQTLQSGFIDWQNAAKKWRDRLFTQENAVEKLAKFAEDKLK